MSYYFDTSHKPVLRESLPYLAFSAIAVLGGTYEAIAGHAGINSKDCRAMSVAFTAIGAVTTFLGANVFKETLRVYTRSEDAPDFRLKVRYVLKDAAFQTLSQMVVCVSAAALFNVIQKSLPTYG